MPMPAKIKWELHEEALQELIKLRNEGNTFKDVAIALQNEFGLDTNQHIVKRAYQKHADVEPSPFQEEVADQVIEDIEDIEYKETHEISKDGSHKSDKLLRMTDNQRKDVNYLLDAHGFDTNEWELVTARNNIWNTYSKQDGINVLYASKITVKPKVNGFNMEKLLDEIKKVPSIVIKRETKKLSSKRLLEIPIFDSHFGVSTFDYYKNTYLDIIDSIQSRHWEEILFVVGQDMLHNDNFKGQTANGTPIEVVDMPNAWKDAKQFYYGLIDEAIPHSNHVKVMFSKGNHDESMGWAFVQLIKERYPQVEIDDSFIERKAHTFGNIFIGITHGDKARRNLHNLFQTEFPMLWAQAKTREVHMGHIHKEDAQDWFGMMVRTLATRNKTDKWHKDNGFVGAHKRFMLFEYNEDELKSIHYV